MPARCSRACARAWPTISIPRPPSLRSTTGPRPRWPTPVATLKRPAWYVTWSTRCSVSRSESCGLAARRRKGDREAGAGVVVVDVHAPAVGQHDVADDGQAQPGATAVTATGVVQTGETFEDAIPVGRGDSGSVVGDGQGDIAAVVVQADGDRVVGVPDGVVEEVGHHAVQGGPVADDLRGRDSGGIDVRRARSGDTS